jgi:probable addiction module antidote protein
VESKRFKDDLREHLRDTEFAASYLATAMEDDAVTDSIDRLLHAVREIAISRRGGIAGAAQAARIGRQTIYDGFKSGGNPQIRTVNAILRTIGLQLTVQPVRSDMQSK